MALTHHGGLTIEDLEAMPEDGRRYELIGGSIVVNASPVPRHQVASSALYEILRAGCPPDHRVFYAPMDLDLVGEQRVEPDLMIVPHTSVGDKRLSLPILLVVELISPSTALWDQVAKRAAYEESGIEHYWLVDTRPESPGFTALRVGDAGVYETVADSAERIEIDAPVQVSTSLASIFEL